MIPSGTFFALAGPSALSAFRAARLLSIIQAIEATAEEVVAQYVHFVHA